MRELDEDGDLQAAAEGGGVDVGVVAADHAGLLERADAAQAGGGGEVDPLGQLDVREAPVPAQLVDDCAIYLVHGTELRQAAVGVLENATPCRGCRAIMS